VNLPDLVPPVVDRLVAAGCVAAEAEAADLLAAAPDRDTLERWLARREQGEPLAWITGTLRFCGRPIHVARGVYVPRFQSEDLAWRATSRLPERGCALDLCTGAGAIAAHLRASVPGARVVGVDLDPRAAGCARRNGVPSLVGDLDAPLRPGALVDLVTAVAPYVPTAQLALLPGDVQRYEPRLALDGGADGLDLVRRVVDAAIRVLRPGGWLLVEVGADQDQELGPTLGAGAFDEVTAWRDDEGDLRGIAARRSDS